MLLEESERLANNLHEWPTVADAIKDVDVIEDNHNRKIKSFSLVINYETDDEYKYDVTYNFQKGYLGHMLQSVTYGTNLKDKV